MKFLPVTRDGWAALIIGVLFTAINAYNVQVQTPPVWAVISNAVVGYLALLSKGAAISINGGDNA